MGFLFQVLILPVALHLNSLGGLEELTDLQAPPCVAWECKLLQVSERFCDAAGLRKISDANIYRSAIEEFLQSWSPGQLQIESTFRALISELLFVYDAILHRAVDKGCLYVHAFALVVSMLRVHLLLLLAGFVQDLCASLGFCFRRSLQRLVAPFSEVIRAAAAFTVRRERPVVPRKVLSVAPISLNAAAIRRRTRSALESLARDSESLAKAGLQPEDVSFHAAELHHIQERCHPMLQKKGDWWLTEEGASSLAVQRGLRVSDVLRLSGVLLPLPCTVLLLEEMPVPGAVFGACGILCAAAVGLLSGGHLAWPRPLLLILKVLLLLLGAAAVEARDEGYAVLSAALLASVDVRPLSSTRFRSRIRLASFFVTAHLAMLSFKQMQAEALTYSELFDVNSVKLLGLPCAVLAVLVSRGSVLISGMLAAIAVLLMQTGRSGLMAAMWWLAACEEISAKCQAGASASWGPAKVPEKVEKCSRISSRQRSSSVPRSGGA